MAIERGDLVEVIHTCCDTYFRRRLLIVFRVASIENIGRARCKHYGTTLPSVLTAADIPGTVGVPLPWLRKINPPTQSQSRETVVPWDQCDWQPEKVKA